MQPRCSGPLYGVVVIVQASLSEHALPGHGLGTRRLSPRGFAPDGSWKLVTRANVAIAVETVPLRRTIAMRPRPGGGAAWRTSERDDAVILGKRAGVIWIR